MNALLVFLQKIEVGGGRKPQDRHIGIHSHLSAGSFQQQQAACELDIGGEINQRQQLPLTMVTTRGVYSYNSYKLTLTRGDNLTSASNS